MIVGGRYIRMYCDSGRVHAEGTPGHGRTPAEFKSDERDGYNACFIDARAAGWSIGKYQVCPLCNPRSGKYVAPEPGAVEVDRYGRGKSGRAARKSQGR